MDGFLILANTNPEMGLRSSSGFAHRRIGDRKNGKCRTA
jgi:hypothetical protein